VLTYFKVTLYCSYITYYCVKLIQLNVITHRDLGTGRKERDKEGEARGDWHVGLVRASLL